MGGNRERGLYIYPLRFLCSFIEIHFPQDKHETHGKHRTQGGAKIIKAHGREFTNPYRLK